MNVQLTSLTKHGDIPAVTPVMVHIAEGLPSYMVMGMRDSAVRESRDRVRAAILSSGYEWPLKRITIDGYVKARSTGHGDVAIALGILAASEQISPALLDRVGVIGGLGLDGSIRTTGLGYRPPLTIGPSVIRDHDGYDLAYVAAGLMRELGTVEALVCPFVDSASVSTYFSRRGSVLPALDLKQAIAALTARVVHRLSGRVA